MTALSDDSWLLSISPQPTPVTAEMYEALSEEISRAIEIVDGYVVFCESPTRQHQTAVRRLADLVESQARSAMRNGHDRVTVNTDVDLRIRDVPLLNLRPDVIVYECLDDEERLRAEHALLVVEIVSPGSETRDTSDKLTEYAKAGIPHYWIVWLDSLGVSVIERYQLDRATSGFKHLGTFMRDEGGDAPQVTTPVPITINWSGLEF